MLTIDELKENEDFKKIKNDYPEYDDDHFVALVFSLGLVACRNALFKSLLNDMVLKD